MAAKWQQWMPFHIDRFRGSPDVQAMHPVARIGYLYLLASAWQTEDCTITSDPLDLASLSGIGDDLWAQYSQRIMRKFEKITTTGRLRNQVLFEEWSEAKRIFEARRDAAINTTKKRSPRTINTVTADKVNGDRTVTDSEPLRSADTITGTVTSTETKKQRQKPCPKAEASEVQSRRREFIDDLKTHWDGMAGTDFVFGGEDGRQVDLFLKNWPSLTRNEWRACLRNRRHSEGIIATQRIYQWVSKLGDYLKTPLDKFHKPIGEWGANAAVSNGAGSKVVGVYQNVVNRRQRERTAGENGDLSTSDEIGRDDPRTIHTVSGEFRLTSVSSGDEEPSDF